MSVFKENMPVMATPTRTEFALNMFYKGTFAGYTKSGRVRVSGKYGIRCYSPANVQPLNS